MMNILTGGESTDRLNLCAICSFIVQLLVRDQANCSSLQGDRLVHSNPHLSHWPLAVVWYLVCACLHSTAGEQRPCPNIYDLAAGPAQITVQA